MIAAPILVDEVVSRQKFRRDLERWHSNIVHIERGWVLLRYDESNLTAELAFLGRLSLSVGSTPLPVVVCAIRLSYENYDLWAPSLTFIDAFTRQPANPHVRAFMSTPQGPRNVLIDSHPQTGLPFLCVPGIREYHSHPQHSGDSWLLYRNRGEGSISTVCDRVWRYMARNIVGLRVEIQSLPTFPLNAQIAVYIAQGDLPEPPPAIAMTGDLLDAK